jgi:hypothetical protein
MRASVKGIEHFESAQPPWWTASPFIADLLFAKELQRRFAGTKKTAYAVHPGVVDTNFARNMGPLLSRVLAAVGLLFLKSVGEGAATEVFAAVSPKACPWRATTSPTRT